MKALLQCSALCASLIIFAAPAFSEGIFESCQLQSRADDKSDGRFIFKPVGNHFANNSVIVAPRCYYDGSRGGSPINVKLFTADGSKEIERARLKTTGNCAGNAECFFASSYLTRRNGKFYKRRYGSISIKISPTKNVTGLRFNDCSYYLIANPAQRAAFRAPVIVPISR